MDENIFTCMVYEENVEPEDYCDSEKFVEMISFSLFP